MQYFKKYQTSGREGTRSLAAMLPASYKMDEVWKDFTPRFLSELFYEKRMLWRIEVLKKKYEMRQIASQTIIVNHWC